MDAFKASARSQKDVLEDFIITYRNEPCLWNIKSREYRDRQRKERGYVKLIHILKSIEPAASREHVVKKINNIRSSYRKEKKKVEQSLRDGAEGDNVYQPKLWYYHLLRFLDDLEGDGEDDYQEVYEESLVDTILQDDDIAAENQDVSSLQSVASNPPMTFSRSSKLKRKSQYEIGNLTNESALLPFHDAYTHPPFSGVEEDRFELFGKLVACKLRSLPRDQEMLAERMINEALFEAEMGLLTLSHKVTSPLNHVNQNSQSHRRLATDQVRAQSTSPLPDGIHSDVFVQKGPRR